MKKGDKVYWTSQSQGSATRKEGEIVGVVPAGERPQKHTWPTFWRGDYGPGFARDHETYIVKVGSKLYWPRASALRLVAA